MTDIAEHSYVFVFKFRNVIYSILYLYTVVCKGILVQDLFVETIALQRIALFTKLVARGNCSVDEKDVAIAWLGELTEDLSRKLDENEANNPRCGGILRCGCGFQ